MRGRKQRLRGDLHVVKVGDMRVAHCERELRRFDARMDILGAKRVHAGGQHPIQYSYDHERHESLRRGRHVVDAAEGMPQREWRNPARRMTFEVGQCERTAQRRMFCSHSPSQIASIEIVETGAREMLERRAEPRLREALSRLR